MMREPIFPANLLLLLFFFPISFAIDTLAPSHPLSNGEILVSKNGIYALGFFSPSDSILLSYLGIWYYNRNRTKDKILWVANRVDPIRHINATVLRLTADNAALQIITTDDSTVIWSSPSSPNSGPNPIAQLLDTGNLVIKTPNSTSYLWQSFDHPTDTLLPGMKLGLDLKTGVDHNLTTWLSDSDPSPGRYVLAVDPSGLPQLVIRDVDSGRWIWRAGPWNGHNFTGLFSELFPNQSFVDQIFNSTPGESYFYFNGFGDAFSILIMGELRRAVLYAWNRTSELLAWARPEVNCSSFSVCGTNAICEPTRSPICHCLAGFSPMNPESWSRGEWSDGCVRVAELDCRANGTDGFMLVNSTRLPDTTDATAYASLGLEGCKTRCLMNCACKAYANSVGTGCIIWMAEIKDLKIIADERSQDLFVRIPSPNEFHDEEQSSSPTNWDRKIMHELDVGKEGSPEVSFFKFSHVVSATDNFLEINKLGQGGFGPVYKGRLAAGQEVAIKRLSARSRQGLEEFKNEILLIAKLRHRNLVRLLGCCIDGEEKMLIYEFMPNKSLDIFLFSKFSPIFEGTNHKFH